MASGQTEEKGMMVCLKCRVQNLMEGEKQVEGVSNYTRKKKDGKSKDRTGVRAMPLLCRVQRCESILQLKGEIFSHWRPFLTNKETLKSQFFLFILRQFSV